MVEKLTDAQRIEALGRLKGWGHDAKTDSERDPMPPHGRQPAMSGMRLEAVGGAMPSG